MVVKHGEAEGPKALAGQGHATRRVRPGQKAKARAGRRQAGRPPASHEQATDRPMTNIIDELCR